MTCMTQTLYFHYVRMTKNFQYIFVGMQKNKVHLFFTAITPENFTFF